MIRLMICNFTVAEQCDRGWAQRGLHPTIVHISNEQLYVIHGWNIYWVISAVQVRECEFVFWLSEI